MAWPSLSASDLAAWVQAVGSLLAIGVAILLPRMDRSRERRQYARTAYSASMNAHAQIAGAWVQVNGLSEHILPMEVIVDSIARATRELDTFPLMGAESAQAVVHMRELSRCAQSVAELVASNIPERIERINRIINVAHVLLILIARELRQPEPPPPPSENGVAPQYLQALHNPRRRVS
jgi:hypothetical protein